MSDYDSRPITRLMAVIYILCILLLTSVYLIIKITDGNFARGPIEKNFTFLLLDIIPKLIVASLTGIVVYVVLERIGLSSGQLLTKRLRAG
jgi:hypothetical protein